LSTGSVVVDRALDAAGSGGDIASDVADVLADAADSVACTQAAQKSGTDEE
jgi:hypothetical protein